MSLPRDRIDRYWLFVTSAVWFAVWTWHLADGIRHDLRLGGGIPWFFTISTTGVSSGLVALFVVGLPLRIIVNLAAMRRRRDRLVETLVCIFTFLVLCWLIVVCEWYPPEG